jgi:protein gp37
MGAKTKIDWADSTWNPVTGCLHGCEYCYARSIANRFAGYWNGEKNVGPPVEADGCLAAHDHLKFKTKSGKLIRAPYPYGFTPTFHHYLLDKPRRWKKPRTIFVCSMADLFGKWVPDEWIQAVFDACANAPQHRYLFLTKNPGRFFNLNSVPFSNNFWYGTTVTGQENSITIGIACSDFVNCYLNIEPIMRSLKMPILDGTKWVIVGAETGNRKGKIIPKREWIECIADDCKEQNIPVFMKESLRELMQEDFVQEFPW